MRKVCKVKLSLLTTLAITGGTLFTSCGLTDLKDNLIAGALAGVKNAATNWVDGAIMDLNEIVEATPDNPLIDTP
jgi:hypothetical protein